MRPSLIVTVLAIALSTPAFAQNQPPQPGTVDFTTPIVSLDGITIKDEARKTADDPTCAKCEALTAGTTVARCLVNDDKVSPEQKPAMWFLAKRIMDSKAATLTPEEIRVIKLCVGKMGAIAAGQIIPLVDPTFKPEAVK